MGWTDIFIVFVIGWARCADSYNDTILGYANSIRTSDGGTHLDGMKAAITRTLNTLGRKSKILKVWQLFVSFSFLRLGMVQTAVSNLRTY